MEIALTDAGRADLAAAAAGEPRARTWKRYRAVLLLADGEPVAAVARALGCAPSSVYNWAAAWRRDGVAGLAEGPHRGAARRLDAAGEAALEALLGQDPQARGHHATGWTVPLLRTEVAAAGYDLSERTVRRALRRLGWRWKRPKFVLGRPDPAYEQKRGASPSAPA
jgi:transposase